MTLAWFALSQGKSARTHLIAARNIEKGTARLGCGRFIALDSLSFDEYAHREHCGACARWAQVEQANHDARQHAVTA